MHSLNTPIAHYLEFQNKSLITALTEEIKVGLLWFSTICEIKCPKILKICFKILLNK